MTHVSVVMPTYNSDAWIMRALGSILSQNLDEFEVILVDDGSSDETEALVRSVKDPRVIYERFKENRGVHEARNRGMELARGDILVFLDADDELLPGALRKCMDVFQGLPEDVGVLYANGVTDSGELTGPAVEDSCFLSIEALLCGTAFRSRKGCLGVVRKSCVGDARWVLPGFDFMFWRQLQLKWKTFALNEVLMRYHVGANSASLSTLRLSRDRRYRQAVRASKIYEEFISKTKPLLKSCPESYAIYLWGFAVTSLLAGRRRVALAAGLETLRYRRDRRAFVLPILAFAPRALTRDVYLRG